MQKLLMNDMIRTILISLFTLIVYIQPAYSGSNVIDEWLMVSFDVFVPAFSTGPFSIDKHLRMDIQSLWPAEGDEFRFGPQNSSTWRKKKFEQSRISIPEDNKDNFIILASYIDVPRWGKGYLHIKTDADYIIMFDGEPIHNGGSYPVTFTQEKHRVFVILYMNEITVGDQCGFEASVEMDEQFSDARPVISTDPIHNFTLMEVLNMPRIGSVAVSPDGSTAAIHGERGSLDIVSTDTGRLLGNIAAEPDALFPVWSPDSKKLAFVLSGNNGRQKIWIRDIEKNISKDIPIEIDGQIRSLMWHPNGENIFYTTRQVYNRKTDYDLVDSFYDRWDGRKAKGQLWIASVQSDASYMVIGTAQYVRYVWSYGALSPG